MNQNPVQRQTTEMHRGLCIANALFWTMTITLPMWAVIAVIWYGLGLINDDGGAAIAGPAVLLTGISLIAGIILSLVKRTLRLEKLPMTEMRRRLDYVMLYAIPAVVILLPAEVIALGKLANENSVLYWIGGGVYLICFVSVFYLLATGMIYRRQFYKRRTFIEFGILLLHGGLYVFMLQSLSLYLSLMILDNQFYLDPWTLVFILLFGISCNLLRRYVVSKEQQ